MVSLYLGLSVASTLLYWVLRLRDGETHKAWLAMVIGVVLWLAAAIQAGPMTGWRSLWLAAGYVVVFVVVVRWGAARHEPHA